MFRACILSCYDKHVALLLSPSYSQPRRASSSSSFLSASSGDTGQKILLPSKEETRQEGDEPRYHIMGYRSSSVQVPSSPSADRLHHQQQLQQQQLSSSSLYEDNESAAARAASNHNVGKVAVEVHPSQVERALVLWFF